jgi:hypothetical protein
MTGQVARFNPPPGWPPPPEGWVPPEGWRPDPSWPPAPAGWSFWVFDDAPAPAPAPSADTAADDVDRTPADSAGGVPPTAADEPPTNPSSAPAPSAPVEPAANTAATDATTPPTVDATAVTAQEKARTAAELEEARTELERVREELAAETARLAERRSSNARLPAPDIASTTGSETPQAVASQLSVEIAAARRELVELNDAVLLQQVGIYEYHHPLENAEAYKDRLRELREQIKESVRSKAAIVTSDRFAYNNSLAQGRKMTADFSKLMLRAYNAEADNCVRSLRAGSIQAAIKRLDTSVETIARLGSMMQMRVSPEYHTLRITELELTSDYLFKVQEEREAAREERERLKEERRAEAELAAERERLDKERAHYANTLAAMQAKGEDIVDLEAQLARIDEAIAANDFRAANIRAGYVYVISNIGTFGPNVVKIGMTRRLEPMDRVRELGDASVPFPFDVHAIYFSDDAVTLENELHKEFGERRMNRVNLRREFFFATPAQVREVLKTKVGNLLEFTESPEATQYYQSHTDWPDLDSGREVDTL